MGKSGQCVGLTTLTPSCADCHEIWESQPPGTLITCPGVTFTYALGPALYNVHTMCVHCTYTRSAAITDPVVTMI